MWVTVCLGRNNSAGKYDFWRHKEDETKGVTQECTNGFGRWVPCSRNSNREEKLKLSKKTAHILWCGRDCDEEDGARNEQGPRTKKATRCWTLGREGERLRFNRKTSFQTKRRSFVRKSDTRALRWSGTTQLPHAGKTPDKTTQRSCTTSGTQKI